MPADRMRNFVEANFAILQEYWERLRGSACLFLLFDGGHEFQARFFCSDTFPKEQ